MKNRILDFVTAKVFQKPPKDILFDAEFHSLQNGVFGFDFRGLGQFIDSHTVSNLLQLLRAYMSMYRSRSCVERLVTQKRLTLRKMNSF